MNMITRILALGLLALPLSAQHTGFSGGAHAFTGNPNSTMGLGLDFAYTGVMKNAEVPFRVGLGYHTFLKEVDSDTKAKLNDMQIAADWFVTKPGSEFSWFIGLSLNKWNVTNSNANRSGSEVKGFKFGFRLGAEYALNRNIALTGVLQATEVGTSSEFSQNDSRAGSRGVNPTWLQVGVRYTF